MRVSRWIWWVAGTFVVVGGGLWLEARHLGLTTSGDELQAQLQLARAEGLPVVPDDLKRPPVPDDENAVNLIVNAYALAEGMPDAPMDVLTQYSKTPPSEAKVTAALQELKPVFDMAEAASRRPHFDAHRRWDLGNDLQFPEFGPLKGISKCLVKRADSEAKSGRFDAADKTLQIVARLGRLTSEEPALIAVFCRMAMENLVLTEAAKLMRLAHGSMASTQLAKSVVNALGPLPDLRFSMGFEVVAARLLLRRLPYWQNKEPDPYGDYVVATGPEDYLLRLNSVADLNDSRLVANYRALYSAQPVKLGDLPTARRTLDRLVNEIDAQRGLANLSPYFSPDFDGSKVWEQCLARRRTVLAGAEILDLRRKTGNFPANWAKPGLDGIDPYIERPLSYRKTTSGFVVYSFGVDGKDDGGRPYYVDGRQDISFEYPQVSQPLARSGQLGPQSSKD